jgi:hypothetical protein
MTLSIEKGREDYSHRFSWIKSIGGLSVFLSLKICGFNCADCVDGVSEDRFLHVAGGGDAARGVVGGLLK